LRWRMEEKSEHQQNEIEKPNHVLEIIYVFKKQFQSIPMSFTAPGLGFQGNHQGPNSSQNMAIVLELTPRSQ
jgi:hypothetical protein